MQRVGGGIGEETTTIVSGDRSDGDHNNRQPAPLLRAACGLCPIVRFMVQFYC